MAARLPRSRYSLAEVGLFYALVLFVIWGSTLWRPPVLLAAVLLIGICIFSNRFHGDTQERIGLAGKNFWPCMKLTALICAPFFFVVTAVAWGKPLRGGWDFWFSVLGYPLWGFAQEYALLGFVANRLEDVWPGRPGALSLANGFLFSLAHLPNPLLMPATFLSGAVFTWIFFKHRHLIPLALAHAVFGVLLSWLTSDILGMMSVGPAYISRMGGWF